MVEGAARRRLAESAGRLRTGRGGRGRAVQVHDHQPVHAGAHAARPPLRRLRSAADGHRGRAGGAGARAAVRVPPGGRGEHPGQSGGRSALRPPRSTACSTRSTGQPRRAPLLRQLRRADDPEGRVARADRISERAARRSPGAGDGAPAGRRSRGAAARWTRASGSASAWWT